MSDEEAWSRAHAAYRKLLLADLKTQKIESELTEALRELFPEDYTKYVRLSLIESEALKKAIKETKKLWKMSLDEFKEMIKATIGAK